MPRQSRAHELSTTCQLLASPLQAKGIKQPGATLIERKIKSLTVAAEQVDNIVGRIALPVIDAAPEKVSADD